MTAILTLGFLLGLQHAMEADHVASVASIVAGQRKLSHIAAHGLFWGIGHALTLAAFVGTIILLRGELPAGLTPLLEAAIGVILIGLGSSVLYRLHKARIHFHLHRHRDGAVHFHAHSHKGDKQPHDLNPHHHAHAPAPRRRRSFIIGVMHGLAGSAAVLALAFPQGGWAGFALVLLFSLGSIIGMVALSGVIAMPLILSGRLATGLNNTLQSAIGGLSVAIGVIHIVSVYPEL